MRQILNMFTVCLRMISGKFFEFIPNFLVDNILNIFGGNLKFIPKLHLKNLPADFLRGHQEHIKNMILK